MIDRVICGFIKVILHYALATRRYPEVELLHCASLIG